MSMRKKGIAKKHNNNDHVHDDDDGDQYSLQLDLLIGVDR